MAYDSYNRIRQVTDAGTGTIKGKYWYDDQGFRVRRVAKTQVDGQDREVELLYPSMYFSVEKQRTASGGTVPNTGFGVNNIYLNGVRIAAALPNGDARYYLSDQVDSVKVVVDDAGMIQSRMEYLPFGETWFQEDKAGFEGKNVPKYNSQELDKESGYYFYNARHYDPEIHRFVTADNVIDGEGDTQGWNRYAYVHNNPIIYKDPTGHQLAPFSKWSVATEVGESQSINQAKTDTEKDNACRQVVQNKMASADLTSKLLTIISPSKTPVSVFNSVISGIISSSKEYQKQLDEKKPIDKDAILTKGLISGLTSLAFDTVPKIIGNKLNISKSKDELSGLQNKVEDLRKSIPGSTWRDFLKTNKEILNNTKQRIQKESDILYKQITKGTSDLVSKASDILFNDKITEKVYEGIQKIKK